MGKLIDTSKSAPSKKRRPALTPEARESRLISMAMDEAEEQFRTHTASSQVITHFLKLGTEKARLEVEKIQLEKELVKAKAEALASTKRSEELFSKAMKAFRGYSGQGDSDEEDYNEY